MLLRALKAYQGRVRAAVTLEIVDDPDRQKLEGALRRLANRRDSFKSRLVVASRPEGEVADVLRASRLYGNVAEIGDHDLFLTDSECAESRLEGVHAATGGWPMLVAAAADGRAKDARELLPTFLRDEVLPTLSDALATALVGALVEPLGASAEGFLGLPAGRCHPLLRRGNNGISIAGHWVAEALLRVRVDRTKLSTDLLDRLTRLHAAYGDPGRSILGLNAIGRSREALAVFERAGSTFFGFRHGFPALEAVLQSFGPQLENRHESLLLARMFLLFKTGQTREALRRLDGLYPNLPVDLRSLQATHRPYALLLRIDIAADLEDSLPAEVVRSWGRLAALLAPDDFLARGILYNTMTLGFLRIDEVLEARQLADEALAAYERAGSPYLVHFMLVHLADIALRQSRLRDVAMQLRGAEETLRRSRLSFRSDQAIIRIFGARLAYEEGRFADCPEDVRPILEELLQGDSWPGLIRTIIGYVPFAAFWRGGLRAGLGTVEQCVLALERRHGPSEDRGLALMRIRLYQIARRHAEANAGLAELDLAPRRACSPHVQAEEGLIRLRSEILQHAPVDSDVQAAKTIAELPELELRQRITLEILQAFLRHRLDERGLSRRHLAVALRLALAEQRIGVLLEDVEILERLLPAFVKDAGIGEEAVRAFGRRMLALMRRLPATGLRSREVAGITRQEQRVLLYVTDGCSNKEVARALNLSESAVKFHLRNLFRKVGVRRRADLRERASALGILS